MNYRQKLTNMFLPASSAAGKFLHASKGHAEGQAVSSARYVSQQYTERSCLVGEMARRQKEEEHAPP